MDIRDLLEKLRSLESQLQEAESDDLAAYQRGKAAQDRLDAIEQVKKLASTPLNQIPRLGDAIDPKTGILYYGAAEGMGDAFTGKATKYPFKWFGDNGPGQTRQFGALLKQAGLEVVPHIEKGLFGNIEYAKVEPEKLAQAIQGTTTSEPQKAPTVSPDISAKLAKLKELIKKYNDSKTTAAAPTVKATESIQPNTVNQNQDGTFTMSKPNGSIVVFDADGKILSESTLSERLIKELTETDMSGAQLGGAVATGGVKAGLAKAGVNTVAKAIPGVGSSLSAINAYNRWKAGDRTGAVISALAGVGWLVPGPMGWVLGGSLDAANIGRDMARSNEEVEAFESHLSKQERIELVRKQIESIEEAVSLGTLKQGFSYADDVYKYGRSVADKLWGKVVDAGKSAKKSIQNFTAGVKSPNVTPLPNTGRTVNTKYIPPSKSFKAGQVVGRNPKKVVAGAVTTTGLSSYMANRPDGGDIAGKPADETPPTTAADFQRTDKDTTPVPMPSNNKPAPRPTKPASGPTAPAQAPAGLDLEGLKGQIRQLTGEIKGSGVTDQDVSDTIKQAEEILQMSVAPIK